MTMLRTAHGLIRWGGLSLALLAAVSCGGGSGDGQGASPGLVLVSVSTAGLDNVALNQSVVMRFSEPLAPGSVGPASIQIREAPTFGTAVPGEFAVTGDGSTVEFRPRLAGLCDLSDGAFKPGQRYRMVFLGFPEEGAVQAAGGSVLDATVTTEFQTIGEAGQLYEDPEPGDAPLVLGSTPGTADPGITDTAVAVFGAQPGGDGVLGTADDIPGNEVRIRVSENLDPCTVNASSVHFAQYQTGDPAVTDPAPNGNPTGFAAPGTDQVPSDPFVWDAGRPSVEQVIDYTVELVNTQDLTEIVVRPTFGEFQDNALLVVQLDVSIRDYGGLPLTPFTVSFTTENQPPQTSSSVLTFEVDPEDLTIGSPPIDEDATTCDVDTERAPGRAQGFLSVTGDGDNGLVLTSPAGPLPCIGQENSGDKTPLIVDTDRVLNTGATPNECPNEIDQSTAVVFEFSELRVMSGSTLTIAGVNPAILLVAGEVEVEAGGRIVLNGGNGSNFTTANTGGIPPGGSGRVGGGDGGDGAHTSRLSETAGRNGYSGYGSPDYDPTMAFGSSGDGGIGAGEGGSNTVPCTTTSGSSQGGGGGAHGLDGGDGLAINTNCGYAVSGVGRGGLAYGADDMLTPSAGAGGGGSGRYQYSSATNTTIRTGGAGGGGGGFLDITSQGAMRIAGTIEAKGGSGGNGGHSNSSFDTAGGGGGAGGAIRLLTPAEIDLTGAVLTTLGGAGGVSGVPGGVPNNQGGTGGTGRIVLEDGDSVITGFGAATLTPAAAGAGLWRAVFNPARFTGGGPRTSCVSLIFAAGPLRPTFEVPVKGDFEVGIPIQTSRGIGKTGILVEMEGYPGLPDGTPDLAGGTGWWTLGHFVDSGAETDPAWIPSANPTFGAGGDVPALPDGNLGAGLGAINSVPGGSTFLRIRVTFYTETEDAGPDDPGPFMDTWTLRTTYDQ